MTRTTEVARPRKAVTTLPVVALAILAYIPALASSPGRMPADSKLYLYLDPGRFMSTAAGSFDPGQFAGWVPHQHIAYLWPSGPFYWFFDVVGVPDWIAHRLWIGTLLFAAGAGILWCARQLDLGPAAAASAAVVYQTSVYVLPYVSRTSVMLLPWAGLGWILGLTVRASFVYAAGGASRWSRWREPALIALVIATIGSVNATALIMIAPAPALWLLTMTGSTGWRWTVGFAARTALLSGVVSLWWAAMLVIQGRFGAPVLPYSETLADVSFTSNATEVWRGLGYWLFYIRDARGPTTTASLPYLISSRTIAVSYLVPLLGLAGLAATTWRYARFGALSIAVGGLFAVGVHPIWDRSPLMQLVGDGGLALALRSSTRALPVMMVGVALGCGALVQAVPRTRGRLMPRVGAGVVLALIAVINLPSLLSASLVDPAIDRDEDPPGAWTSAASDLDDTVTPTGGRVLQVPGIEFGAYRWGITVDQPVAGLTDKALVTRDLLPLGSAAAMDVLYALDDRIQAGTVDADSIRAGAQMLGADTIWLTGDLDYPRYQAARPSDLLEPLGEIGQSRSYGEILTTPPPGATEDEATLSRPLQPVSEVVLVELSEPSQVLRVDSDLVALAGSGDGIVDSSAVHDVADRAALIYTADRPAVLDEVAGLIVTDSNRNRNRHWRSSQDSTGATLTADDPVTELERSQRLAVFSNTDTASQTVAVQDGPIGAFASRYGEPFGFQPEHRAVMAIDGDPATAWTVGEHGDPVGASLVLHTSVPVDELEFTQFGPIDGQRQIASATVRVDYPSGDGRSSVRQIDLSVTRRIDVAADAAATITVTIDSVVGGEPFTEGIVADVGFSEIVAYSNGVRVDPTTEWIRTPVDTVELMATRPDLPFAFSLRRDRVDPTNPWRSDPEPTLRRIVTTGSDQMLDITPTVRMNPDVSDRDLADLYELPAWSSSVLAGSPHNGGFAALDDDPATAWLTSFDGGDGAELHVEAPSAPVDTLSLQQPPRLARITSVNISQGDRNWDLDIPDDGDSSEPTSLRLDPPLDASPFVLRITGTDAATTIDRRFGDVRALPVGIAELSFAGRPATGSSPVGVTGCVPLVTLDGEPLTGRISPPALERFAAGDRAVLEVTMCDESVELVAGPHRIATSSDAPVWLTVDGVEARNPGFVELSAQDPPQPTVESVTGDRFNRTVTITGCPAGCWFVFGEGLNAGWVATADGRDLGPATLLDGTSNGWWVSGAESADGRATVTVNWEPQRSLRWAFFASVLGVVMCFAIVVIARRRSPAPPGARGTATVWTIGTPMSTRSAVFNGAAVAATAWLVGGPSALGWSLIGVIAVLVVRRTTALMWSAAGLVAITAFAVVLTERGRVLVPDATWPDQFRSWHALGMAAFACTAVYGVVAKPSAPGSSR